MAERQLDTLLTDHYDRLIHPPKVEPEFNLKPALNKFKSVISFLPQTRPTIRRTKPKLQP